MTREISGVSFPISGYPIPEQKFGVLNALRRTQGDYSLRRPRVRLGSSAWSSEADNRSTLLGSLVRWRSNAECSRSRLSAGQHGLNQW